MYAENFEKVDSFHTSIIEQFYRSKINRLIEETRRENAIREIVKNTPEIEARDFGEISFDSSSQRLKNGVKIIEGADPESTNILGAIVNLFQRKVLELEDLETFFENGKANNCFILEKTENPNFCSVRICPRRAIRFLKKYLRRNGEPLPDFLKFKYPKKELAD